MESRKYIGTATVYRYIDKSTNPLGSKPVFSGLDASFPTQLSSPGYSAAISALRSAPSGVERARVLFDAMQGARVQPNVVSCSDDMARCVAPKRFKETPPRQMGQKPWMGQTWMGSMWACSSKVFEANLPTPKRTPHPSRGLIVGSKVFLGSVDPGSRQE